MTVVAVETNGHLLTQRGDGICSFTLCDTDTQRTITVTCRPPKIAETTGTGIMAYWHDQLANAYEHLK